MEGGGVNLGVPGSDIGDNNDGVADRVTLVLSRPSMGRWYQIRQHLSQNIWHPMLGDSAHGLSRTNRAWRERGGGEGRKALPPERSFLHLATVSIPRTEYAPGGVEASCPLPGDMMGMMERYMPVNVLERCSTVLEEEGVAFQKFGGQVEK